MTMTDLVGTCPKDFWLEWIAEGDAAGDPDSGAEYGWYTLIERFWRRSDERPFPDWKTAGVSA